MKRRPPIRAILQVLVAMVGGLAIAGGALYWWTGSHPIGNGVRGCELVRDRPAQTRCVANVFSRARRDYGLDEALKRSDGVARGSELVGKDCHMAWHIVGTQDGRKRARAHKDVPSLPWSSFCQDGYVHGYLIGYLEVAGVGDDLGAAVRKSCTSKGQKSGEVANCVHAYGHAFANRWKRTDERTGTACTRAAAAWKGDGEKEHDLMRMQCLYGSYMQYFFLDRDASSHPKLNICDDAPAVAAEGCWAYLPGRVLEITGDDQRAAKSCNKMAPDGLPHDRCVEGYSQGSNSINDCENFPDEADQERCRGIVTERMSGGQSPADANG